MKLLTKIALITVVAAGSAHAGPKQQAKAHVAAATRAHQQGNYDLALTELQAAYKLDPKPELLFAMGQVEAKLSRCQDAIDHYEKFTATVKDAATKAVVTQAIDACRAQLEAQKPPAEPVSEPPPPVAEPVAPAPPPAEPIRDAPPLAPGRSVERVDRVEPPPRSPERSPWYKDPLGDTLVIGGMLAIAGSAVIYQGARGKLTDAETATSLDQYDKLLGDARSARTQSLILVGGGVALIGVGVVRYVMRGSRADRVSVVPTPHGGLVTMQGRF